jgi:tRNA threonylcarbamoyladenosine biosynthesis protein TsaE
VTAAPIVARTSSPGETRRLAAALARELTAGDLLLLVGALGTGKTTFTQGLARGLGVTDPVTSPTFTLVRAYPCASGGASTLLHADLYRLDRLADVVDLGLAEMVEDDSVAVVEWGDVAASVFGPDVLTVRLADPADRNPAPGGRPDAGPTRPDRARPDDERPDEPRIVTVVPGGTWAPRRDALAARLEPWAEADAAAGGRRADGA